MWPVYVSNILNVMIILLQKYRKYIRDLSPEEKARVRNMKKVSAQKCRQREKEGKSK